ncbi:lysine-specific demethylase JMJ30 [Echria macrotheca]|uniref:Lysine-specific demethylase JMJ30 n=1 Tax=Echria macrotheca TaxID=438768 RepID=A0AAJ0BMX6_9PEZI|nr:lysine-specific demethylase JMJ30 [Echria macrotheca]
MPCRSFRWAGVRITCQRDVFSRRLSTVCQTQSPVNIADFQRDAFHAERPLAIRKSANLQDTELPAMTEWFSPSSQFGAIFTPHLQRFSAASLPYELILPANNASDPRNIHHFLDWLARTDDPFRRSLASFLTEHISYLERNSETEPGTRFLRFEAPLALLEAGLRFNQESPDGSVLQQLYIAQAPLNTLPKELQDDVPAPDIVTKAGRGDIYDSSVWIGLEPTYTPWHRDPNPNLFYQLWSSKVVRLMPPRRGEQLFLEARARLGHGGSSRIRGEEMMQGAERQVLLDAVWGKGVSDDMSEVSLDRGDALFIPKGWWHSVKSAGSHGSLNASVNWWFR